MLSHKPGYPYSDRWEFSRCIAVALLLLDLIAGAQGRISISPSDRVMSKGDTNVFTCCSDDTQTSITWKRRRVGSLSEEEIYHLGGLINGYRTNGRFKVTSSSNPGCFSLTTTNVSRGDEGKYTCTDNAGLGHSKGWELVMLETFKCQEKKYKAEYMGENYFGLQQDVISMVCFFEYFGIMRPKLLCEWSSGTKLYDNYHYVTQSNASSTVTIHIPARKELNGDYLSCYATIEEESRTNQSSTSWKSRKFKVNYAYYQQKVVSQCNDEELSLDCQPACNYNMKQFDNGSSYCEITHSLQPARTYNVLLKEITKPQDHQSTLSGIGRRLHVFNIICAIVFVLYGAYGLIREVVVPCCRKAQCLQRNRRTNSTGCCCCGLSENIENAPEAHSLSGRSENSNVVSEHRQRLSETDRSEGIERAAETHPLSGDITATESPPSYKELQHGQ